MVFGRLFFSRFFLPVCRLHPIHHSSLDSGKLFCFLHCFFFVPSFFFTFGDCKFVARWRLVSERRSRKTLASRGGRNENKKGRKKRAKRKRNVEKTTERWSTEREKGRPMERQRSNFKIKKKKTNAAPSSSVGPPPPKKNNACKPLWRIIQYNCSLSVSHKKCHFISSILSRNIIFKVISKSLSMKETISLLAIFIILSIQCVNFYLDTLHRYLIVFETND